MKKLVVLLIVLVAKNFSGVKCADVSQQCLDCICQASSGCNLKTKCHNAGENAYFCGPYQISFPYWSDGGKPGYTGSAQDFVNCLTDKYCAEVAIRGYMDKWQKDCNNDGVIDCLDYGAIHKAGASGCGEQWLFNSKYWNEFRQCHISSYGTISDSFENSANERQPQYNPAIKPIQPRPQSQPSEFPYKPVEYQPETNGYRPQPQPQPQPNGYRSQPSDIQPQPPQPSEYRPRPQPQPNVYRPQPNEYQPQPNEYQPESNGHRSLNQPLQPQPQPQHRPIYNFSNDFISFHYTLPPNSRHIDTNYRSQPQLQPSAPRHLQPLSRPQPLPQPQLQPQPQPQPQPYSQPVSNNNNDFISFHYTLPPNSRPIDTNYRAQPHIQPTPPTQPPPQRQPQPQPQYQPQPQPRPQPPPHPQPAAERMSYPASNTYFNNPVLPSIDRQPPQTQPQPPRQPPSEPNLSNSYIGITPNSDARYARNVSSNRDNSEEIPRDCMDCICQASSKCNANIGCQNDGLGGFICGAYQMNWAYWSDAGKPSLNGNNLQNFQMCLNDKDCAEATVYGYMSKWKRDCNDDKQLDCYDYAAIHKAGPSNCNAQSFVESQYWSDFRECFDFRRK